MAKQATVTLSNEQMGFVTSASTAIAGWLNTENKAKSDVKTLKEEAKKAIATHKSELNLAMKGLKLTKFRFTGTAKSNKAIKALYDAFIASGQTPATASNSLLAVKAYYNGDVGAGYKFPNGLEIQGFNATRIKQASSFVGLLDGKTVKVDRDDVSCAKWIQVRNCLFRIAFEW